MKISEIQSRSIFVKSKLPGADYVANPYSGCQFGCSYCYAVFMSRYTGEDALEWGSYVQVKKNAVELARTELSKWSEKKRHSSIFMSSVTDCYQGIEAKYRLTRGILEALADSDYPGPVGILTKSPLVTRDIDVLSRIRDIEVGLTVTGTGDESGRKLELYAPPGALRLKALSKLSESGIPVYAFAGPLLPHYRFRPDLLEELISGLKDSGVRRLYVEHLNMKPYIRERLLHEIRNESMELKQVYLKASAKEHQDVMDEILRGLLEKYGLELIGGRTIRH